MICVNLKKIYHNVKIDYYFSRDSFEAACDEDGTRDERFLYYPPPERNKSIYYNNLYHSWRKK